MSDATSSDNSEIRISQSEAEDIVRMLRVGGLSIRSVATTRGATQCIPIARRPCVSQSAADLSRDLIASLDSRGASHRAAPSTVAVSSPTGERGPAPPLPLADYRREVSGPTPTSYNSTGSRNAPPNPWAYGIERPLPPASAANGQDGRLDRAAAGGRFFVDARRVRGAHL